MLTRYLVHNFCLIYISHRLICISLCSLYLEFGLRDPCLWRLFPSISEAAPAAWAGAGPRRWAPSFCEPRLTQREKSTLSPNVASKMVGGDLGNLESRAPRKFQRPQALDPCGRGDQLLCAGGALQRQNPNPRDLNPKTPNPKTPKPGSKTQTPQTPQTLKTETPNPETPKPGSLNPNPPKPYSPTARSCRGAPQLQSPKPQKFWGFCVFRVQGSGNPQPQAITR